MMETTDADGARLVDLRVPSGTDIRVPSGTDDLHLTLPLLVLQPCSLTAPTLRLSYRTRMTQSLLIIL